MVSTLYLLVMLSVFHCGIVISKGSALATSNSPIPLSELVGELLREPKTLKTVHLTYIFMVESYGDHLYDLTPTLSAECFTAIKATSIVFQKLAYGFHLDEAVMELLGDSMRDIENTTKLEEHPLEFWCRKLAQLSPENEIIRAIEKAKIEAANSSLVSGRPPYYNKVLKLDSLNSFYFEIVDKFTVPEVARLVAVSSFFFTSQRRAMDCSNSSGFSPLRYYFTKTCLALAKQEKLADKMQSIFVKVMNETIPAIAVADRHERIKACSWECGCWWISKMMKAMYNYIVRDPILETELNKTAYSIAREDNGRLMDIQFYKL